MIFELTPLRDWNDDIPLLVDHFLKGHAKEHSHPVPTVTPEAMDALMVYDCPCDVRELSGGIERAMVLCDGAEIEVADRPDMESVD
jgi:DNA-binding NtrC family response regulator